MRELRRQRMNIEALDYFGDVEDPYSSSDSEGEKPLLFGIPLSMRGVARSVVDEF